MEHERGEPGTATHGAIDYVYRHDIVKNNRTGCIGVVREVAGDSDSESDISDEDVETRNEENVGHGDCNAHGTTGETKVDGNYKCDALEGDQIRVRWIDSTEPVQRIKDVTVVDRKFFIRDYVASADDPTGQMGVVVDVDISVDLLAHDDSILNDISTKKLKRDRDFAAGDVVVLGTWLGIVDELHDYVTVLSDDGQQFKDIHRSDPENLAKLKVIRKNNLEDEDAPYQLGQRVTTPFSKQGTVIKATTGALFVRWIISAVSGSDSSAIPPPPGQFPSNCTLLSSYAHANWKVGDWGLLNQSATLTAEALPKETSEDLTQKFSSISMEHVITEDKEEESLALLVVNSKTYVTVGWQDGSTERRESTSLIPIKNPVDHEFVSEQYVVEKASGDGYNTTEPKRVGVVKSVNAKECIASVRWLKPLGSAEEPPEFDREEIVSVYELEVHPHYDFRCGIFVRSSSATTKVDTNLAWVGIITGLKDGCIEVTWANGMVSTVGPQEVYVIPTEYDDQTSEENEASDAENEASDAENEASDASSWETADNDERGSREIPEEDAQTKAENNDEPSFCFRLFDILVDAPLDHNFLGKDGQKSNEKQWWKKVNKDWEILKNDLPVDLMRAVIIGPYGTPYQDGVFCFDFQLQLPPDYPDVPPRAYYHSRGWKLNPNLNGDGSICLSLFNTWKGRGTEAWDPNSSSMLQILVSLQGLVLNSKPYFNEAAGYHSKIGTAEGEKNSLGYNENAFLLNCKTMISLMRSPLEGFEELIREHFKRRGDDIMKTCDTKVTSVETSQGFKQTMGKLRKELFSLLK